MNRTSFLDFQEWERIGQPIKSTSSVEAVKLYDAAVCQSASWFDNPTFGGFEGTLQKMRAADPDFLLGRALTLSSTLMGFTDTAFNNADIKKEVDELRAAAEKRRDDITEREYDHVQAAIRFAEMDWQGAADCWEKVLRQAPTDMFALKTQLFVNFFRGLKMDNFNMVDRVYSAFEKAPTYHSQTIDGYYAFVNEEIGRYETAEPLARKGLEKYPYDGWTTHALAHILEMQGRFDEGRNIMTSTVKNWVGSNHIGCHNWWHLALFNVSVDDFDTAIEILDSEIMPRAKASQGTGPIDDVSSMLYRLLLLNDASQPRYDDDFFQSHFDDVYGISEQYMRKNVNPFQTLHYLMGCLGSGRRSEAEDLIEDFKNCKHAELYPETNQLGQDMMQAFMYYDEGAYTKATNILAPLRHRIVEVGGSDAQRDVFDDLLLVCTLKSSTPEHRDLFKVLTAEREATKRDDLFISKITK